MNTRTPLTVALMACGMLFFGLPNTAFAACDNATPCTWMLYAKSTTSALHLAYGDRLELRFTGNKTELRPYAANWELGDINLKPTIVFDSAGDPLDPQKGWIIPAWEFKFKTASAHTPADREHLKAVIYKHPASNEWVVKSAEHSDGSTHGGTAHMTD